MKASSLLPDGSYCRKVNTLQPCSSQEVFMAETLHRRPAALRQAAEALAERYGVAFLYRDFRPGFRQGQAKARELGLYMQKYCGCVFSEEERYAKAASRYWSIAKPL